MSIFNLRPAYFSTGLLAAGGLLTFGSIFYPDVALFAVLLPMPLLVTIFNCDEQNISESRKNGQVLLFITFGVPLFWVASHHLWQIGLMSVFAVMFFVLMFDLPFRWVYQIRLRKGKFAAFLFLISSVLTLEWIFSQGIWAFPWMTFGRGLTGGLFDYIAMISGPAGLSFTAWGFSAVLAGVFYLNYNIFIKTGISLVVFLILSWPISFSPADSAQSINIGTVSPALVASDWARQDDGARVDYLLYLSDYLITENQGSGEMPDLIVWPETAIPPMNSPADNVVVLNHIQAWVDLRGIGILSGAILHSDGPAGWTNSALLFTPNQSMQIKHKYRLVAGAEYLPWQKYTNLMMPSAGGTAGYDRSEFGQSLVYKNLKILPLMCMETGFPRDVLDQPDLLVGLSQHGWWASQDVSYQQQLQLSRTTALSAGRPFVMVAVTQPAQVLDFGKQIESTRTLLSPETKVFKINLASKETYFNPNIDWLSFYASAGCILWIIILLRWHFSDSSIQFYSKIK